MNEETQKLFNRMVTDVLNAKENVGELRTVLNIIILQPELLKDKNIKEEIIEIIERSH